MNRKGYTFIELLGVIVILGLVLVISIPSITKALKTSRIKSEKIFLDKLSDTVDSYITMNSNSFTFTPNGTSTKTDALGNTKTVTIYKVTTTVNSVITDGLITKKDFIDPAYKKQCSKNAEIEIYRDSDYVYCHKIKKTSLDCLSDDYINQDTNEYAIDTCIWE